jgi:SecD/SecF fusion protein
MSHFPVWKIVVVVLGCVLGVMFAAPNLLTDEEVAGLPQFMPHQKVNLGLDLQGGSYLLMEVDFDAVLRERAQGLVDSARTILRRERIGYQDLGITNDGGVSFTLTNPADAERARSEFRKAETDVTIDVQGNRMVLRYSEQATVARKNQVLEQSIEIVRRRVDELGTTEPSIQRQGENRILVQLPGLNDPERIKNLLGKTAKMNFQLVDVSMSPEDARATGRIPPGDDLLPEDKGRNAQGNPVFHLVQKQIAVGGETLVDAQPSFRDGRPVVTFRFDAGGGRKFAEITRSNVGRPFAIVLDNKVISAPVIREPILGGSGEISGNFTTQEAKDLALLLRAGALPAPLKVVEERSVGPDLGADSIKSGTHATILGLVLVLAYMLLSYGRFGLFADVAVLLNLVLTIAALSLLQATLTLPGIAGLLLTVGMSVDANILINERTREEILNGRSPMSAIEAGFTKAWATIIDSNLTTLIKMAILYLLGAGVVRGFAVTIFLGILISMFTSIVLVRLMMTSWLRRVRPKQLKISLIRLIPDKTNIAFMKGRFVGIAMSAFLSLASIALCFTPGLNKGIDFLGGIQIELKTQGTADFAALRSSLDKLGLGDVKLQQFGGPDQVLIRIDRQAGGDEEQQAAIDKVKANLVQNFPGSQIQSTAAVGATVSNELFWDGMKALGLALVAMLGYIWFRFEWQFGVGAVLTLILDVTKTLGFFAITGAAFGWQFNLESIAAILTIMGYSINDKVVVYDRVRENLRKYKSMPLRQLIDLSINETLARTVGTSISVFLATLPLALVGGQALHPFAWAMLFGIVLSTTSSIMIAAPILLILGENKLRRNTTTTAASPGPATA